MRSPLDGMRAYAETLKIARATGLPVIADIKRGDIAKTAEMYAKAHFTGDFEADIITLAPTWAWIPSALICRTAPSRGKGVFVLCRTSNPARRILSTKLDDGRHVYDLVGDSLTALGKDYMGEHGYSSIGLVIGGHRGHRHPRGLQGHLLPDPRLRRRAARRPTLPST